MMTVEELKKRLEQYPDEAEVFVDAGDVNLLYVDEVDESEDCVILR